MALMGSGYLQGKRHPEACPYRLRLYKTTEHAETLYGEDYDEDNVRTMPRRVKKQIYTVLGIPLKPGRCESSIFPNERRPQLEPIPEGEENPADPPPQDDNDDEVMSEGIDPNEEPASDEDEVSTDVERFEPSTAQLRDLKLAHDNAGHPTNADFARGFSEEGTAARRSPRG